MNSSRRVARPVLAAATALVGACAAALLTAPAATAEAYGGPARSVVTSEQDCFEFGESQGVPTSTLPAALFQRFTPVLVPTNPTRTLLYLVDYVCDETSVGPGSATWPRASLTTIGIVQVLDRATGTRGAYMLWHGTTNPQLASVLTRLGAPTTVLQDADATVTDLGGGRSRVTYRVGDSAVAHSREATAVEPATEPVTTSPAGSFRYAVVGDMGLVQVAFDNSLRPTSTASSVVTVPPDSGLAPYFAHLAQPVVLTRPSASFTRGSWTGTYTLVP